MAGSSGSCAVKVGYTNGNGLCTAFKIRTYRSYKYTELIFVGRLNADNRI